MADSLAMGATTNALVAPGQSFASTIERQLQLASDPEGAATVLEVLPVRETLPEPPEAVLTTPTYLPYVLIGLILLAGLLLAIWFFFLR